MFQFALNCSRFLKMFREFTSPGHGKRWWLWYWQIKQAHVSVQACREITTEDWWLSQPRIRRELRTGRARCRAPCLLQSLDLCRQLSDSSLIFHLGLSDQPTDHGLHGLVLWNHGCVGRSSACSAPLDTRRGKFSLFHCITCELCFQLVSHARRCAHHLSDPSTHELRYHVD